MTLTFSNIRFVLLDIEGTIASIDFVHQTLFPYAAKHLKSYVLNHLDDATVHQCLSDTQAIVLEESGEKLDTACLIETLLAWIQADRKIAPLKTLQGLIWKTGFEQGDYQGHLYPEVPEVLKQWHAQGIGLGIYSSGSVAAQKLLLQYSCYGDLTPLMSVYFDTAVGGKKEASSYQAIAEHLIQTGAIQSANEILFLSDVPEELDAAQLSTLQACQLQRGDNAVFIASNQHTQVGELTQIKLTQVCLN